ncbi:hypothetical protein LCGC14_2511890 [marine sediment metagenome]|uniref:Uncharacterized protein n=1 Tax=marine sediment metagenome TaxID=412755 RepID=A0A0F9DAP4_9ZZZZ
MTSVSGGLNPSVWTDARAVFLDNINNSSLASAKFVKSIQHVEIVISDSSSTNTGAISSVDTAKCMIIKEGEELAAGTGGSNVEWDFDSATVIRVRRSWSDNVATCQATIVEFF